MLGGSAILRQPVAGTRQASFSQPGSKNQFNYSMSSVSDIKLIRTDLFIS